MTKKPNGSEFGCDFFIRTNSVGKRLDGSARGAISAIDAKETARGCILKQVERGHCVDDARAQQERPAREKEKRTEARRHDLKQRRENCRQTISRCHQGRCGKSGARAEAGANSVLENRSEMTRARRA